LRNRETATGSIISCVAISPKLIQIPPIAVDISWNRWMRFWAKADLDAPELRWFFALQMASGDDFEMLD